MKPAGGPLIPKVFNLVAFQDCWFDCKCTMLVVKHHILCTGMSVLHVNHFELHLTQLTPLESRTKFPKGLMNIMFLTTLLTPMWLPCRLCAGSLMSSGTVDQPALCTIDNSINKLGCWTVSVWSAHKTSRSVSPSCSSFSSSKIVYLHEWVASWRSFCHFLCFYLSGKIMAKRGKVGLAGVQWVRAGSFRCNGLTVCVCVCASEREIVWFSAGGSCVCFRVFLPHLFHKPLCLFSNLQARQQRCSSYYAGGQLIQYIFLCSFFFFYKVWRWGCMHGFECILLTRKPWWVSLPYSLSLCLSRMHAHIFSISSAPSDLHAHRVWVGVQAKADRQLHEALSKFFHLFHFFPFLFLISLSLLCVFSSISVHLCCWHHNISPVPSAHGTNDGCLSSAWRGACVCL